MVHVVSSVRVLAHANHTPPKPAQSNASTGSPVPQTPSFNSWFPGTITGAGPAVPDPPSNPAPTAESVFGPNPWLSNPTGAAPNGITYSYNPLYFATPQTAAKVAQMVGGTVVESNSFTTNGGPFAQQQPCQMVRLADGRLINAGLVASFYTHGYPQSYIDKLVAAEVNNT